MKASTKQQTLVVSCPDSAGIVAAVSGFIADRGGLLVEANHHTDLQQSWFYMRNVIDMRNSDVSFSSFKAQFQEIAEAFQMQWSLRSANTRQKVVLLASRLSHCLADLLHRWQDGELECDIPCVISNHEDLRRMVEWHGIPFHHVPVDRGDKSAAFAKTLEITQRHEADSVVLARYMQILPTQFCEAYSGRLINIHHSFLPSFVGADPYQQAYDRGVKLIGATCHYVTEDLDEGPIIEQDVIRVGHNCDRQEMIRRGRDVEKLVLARGLRYHLEDRVLLQGNKAVVFS